MKNWRIFCIKKVKTSTIFFLLFLVLLIAIGLSICLGSVTIPMNELVKVITGVNSNMLYKRILLYVRLPRTLGCVLAGAALAVSGAVIQTVLANPLASPNIIGVNSGSGFAIALYGVLASAGGMGVSLVSVFGALLGTVLILFLSERGKASRMTLVLAGMAVSGMFGACIDSILTFFPDALVGYSDFRIGSLANLSMEKIIPATGIILVCMGGIWALSAEMDILILGDDIASSLGLRARPMRMLILFFAAGLAGAAVSFSGLLGFVGLIVPHILRGLVDGESRILVAACTLGGAAYLTICDVIARIVCSPYELPVGIVLSLLGGPFFLWLLLRRKGGTHD